MAQIWLISDTHFGHENIYKFLREDGVTRVRHEFANAAEGDAAMIERWNEIVKPSDHVYHLGDVALSLRDLQTVRKLNGHKRLVLGNHDREKITAYRDVGFEKIFGARRLDGLLLTHYPVHAMSISHKVRANVHGHIHDRMSPPGRYINISVEQTSYGPVSLDELLYRVKFNEEHLEAWKRTEGEPSEELFRI